MLLATATCGKDQFAPELISIRIAASPDRDTLRSYDTLTLSVVPQLRTGQPTSVHWLRLPSGDSTTAPTLRYAPRAPGRELVQAVAEFAGGSVGVTERSFVTLRNGAPIVTLTRIHAAYAARVPLGDTVLITAAVSDPDGDTILAARRQWYRETTTGLVPLGIGDSLRLGVDSELVYGLTFVAADPAGARTSARTSVSGYDPVTLARWRVRSFIPYRSPISITPPGRIVLQTNSGLAEYDTTGIQTWEDTIGALIGPLVVAGNGDIFFQKAAASLTGLRAASVSAAGVLRWVLPQDSLGAVQPPVLLSNGNLGFTAWVSGSPIRTYWAVVDAAGNSAGLVNLDTLSALANIFGLPGGPAVAADGSVYVPNRLGTGLGVTAIAPNGTVAWRFDYGAPGTSNSTTNPIAVADDSTILFTTKLSAADSVFALRSDGSVRWAMPLGDGIIVVGLGAAFISRPGRQQALDLTDGHVLWSAAQPGSSNSSAYPVLTANGRLYVAGASWVIGYDAATGIEVYRHQTAGEITSAPALTDGGLLILHDFYGVLEAIPLGAGPLDSPWPQTNADGQRTSRVRVP